MHCVFSLLREIVSFIMPTVCVAKHVFFLHQKTIMCIRFIGVVVKMIQEEEPILH